MSEQESTTEALVADTATETAAVEAPATEHDDTFDATRALDKIRKVNAEAKAMRDRAKAAEDKVATLEADASEVPKLRESLMRAEVALELGLPMSLAKRLQGATAEEMKADAETLLALVAPKAPKQQRPVEALQPGSGKADPSVPAQLTRAELQGMKPEQIVAAKAAGQLNDLLGIK